jgi:hypothetical protein
LRGKKEREVEKIKSVDRIQFLHKSIPFARFLKQASTRRNKFRAKLGHFVTALFLTDDLLLSWTTESPALPQVPRQGKAFKIGP